jgi:putative ABC transport system permease protein
MTLESCAIELRQALRGLRRAPGVAAAAVLVLALGIGGSTAIFSLVHGILLEPLPYRDADRLVMIQGEIKFDGASGPARTSYPTEAVAAWPAESTTFEQVAFFAGAPGALARGPVTDLVDVAYVAGPFFDVVAGPMSLARGLAPEDGSQAVAVISTRLWRQLHADAAAIEGRAITLNGEVLNIVGVAADSFQVPSRSTDVWLPAGFVRLSRPDCCPFAPIARLRAGATMAAATEEAAAITTALAKTSPRALADATVRVVRLQDTLVSDVRPALLVLMAAVALLLLLAGANVCAVLLARNRSRSHEIDVRRALGASGGRILVQTMAESTWLCAAGGAAGLALAALCLRLLAVAAADALPRFDSVRLDGAVLAFAVATSALVTIGVGLIPALRRRDRAVGIGRPTTRALRALTVTQMALSAVLLVGATLLGRSLQALLATDIGITSGHVATASLHLAMGRTLSDRQQVEIAERVVARIGTLPGVVAAGVGAARPPDVSRMRLTLRRPEDAPEKLPYMASAVPATPGYFAALGIRLERGRLFTAADDVDAPPVVILSHTTARRFFPDVDPVGRSMSLPELRDGKPRSVQMTVIGVAADVKYSGLDKDADDAVYRPFAQQPVRAPFLVARTVGDPAVVVAQLQRLVAATDPGIVVSQAATLDAVLADVTVQPRLRSMVLVAVAATALLIAAVGLYGLVSYSVWQRRREIAVRIAVGADRQRITSMILREGLGLVLMGGAVGLAAALAASRLLTSLLFGTSPTDPGSFTLVGVVLVVVAIAAGYVPARRAAAIDPIAALRAE